MNIKRYIAEDVSEAINKIREELGRDAFILSTRKIRRKGMLGFFKKPLVEVVAAYEKNEKPVQGRFGPIDTAGIRRNQNQPDAGEITQPLWQQAYAAQRNTADFGDGFEPYVPEKPNSAQVNGAQTADNERMKRLEEKIDSVASSVLNLASKMQIAKNDFRNSYVADVEKYLLSLVENEVHQEFAHKIAKEVNDIVLRSEADPEEVMEQILRQYIGDPAPIKQKKFQRTVVLFIGPTGVGKTTTLAKLAAIYSLNHHARVAMITTDTYRIGAVEQLKTYAEILNIPLGVVYSPEEISEVLKGYEDADIVMIDTAGRSPNDRSQETEIRELIKHADVDEVYLVMSVTTSFTGCINITNTYSFLRDYKLIVTKMDETPAWGMFLNLKFLTDKPVAYIAAGQTVPDDIEVADPKKVISRLMGKDGV